jgi:hypothetical protein
LESQKIDVILFEYGTGWLCSRRLLKEAVDFFVDKPYKLFKLFNGFLVPYKYNLCHEGTLFSMFVAIRLEKIKRMRDLKIRNVEI